MTRITIQQDGGVFRLSANGHAQGSVQVCAAVSAILFALGGYLQNLERQGSVRLETFLLESGTAELAASGPDARVPFEMAAVGLLQVQQGHGAYIEVRTENIFSVPWRGIMASLV